MRHAPTKHLTLGPFVAHIFDSSCAMLGFYTLLCYVARETHTHTPTGSTNTQKIGVGTPTWDSPAPSCRTRRRLCISALFRCTLHFRFYSVSRGETFLLRNFGRSRFHMLSTYVLFFHGSIKRFQQLGHSIFIISLNLL